MHASTLKHEKIFISYKIDKRRTFVEPKSCILQILLSILNVIFFVALAIVLYLNWLNEKREFNIDNLLFSKELYLVIHYVFHWQTHKVDRIFYRQTHKVDRIFHWQTHKVIEYFTDKLIKWTENFTDKLIKSIEYFTDKLIKWSEYSSPLTHGWEWNFCGDMHWLQILTKYLVRLWPWRTHILWVIYGYYKGE